jgi:outer membrane protein insertion porin family
MRQASLGADPVRRARDVLPGPLRILLLGAFLFGAASAAGAADLLPGTAPSDSLSSRPVSKITVSGNQTTDSNLILRTTGLEAGAPISPDRVQAAVRSLYGLGLFSDVAVRDWLEPDGTRGLEFKVTENPRVSAITWTGNKKLGEDDLKGKIDLKPGQVLTRKKLFEAQRAVEAAYLDQGFASAKIQAVVSEPVDGKVEVNFRIEEGTKVDITGIDFEGNKAFTSHQLLAKLDLKPNSLLHHKRFTLERQREDQTHLEEFYRNNGYKDAQVTSGDPVYSPDRRQVRLRYVIHEGSLYRFGDVQWSGNSAVPTEALRAASTITAGTPYSKAKLDATTGAAYELYTEKGYLLQLSINPETTVKGSTVDVNYVISEGEPSHVREVTILGNTRTKERVIRREMTLMPGQLLRRSSLLRTQRDVFALGYFEDVQLDYQPAGDGTNVDVSYTVKEKSSGTATAGAAYSSGTGITGFIEFGHNNLFGNGQSINVHLERGGKRENYDISFTEPWAFGNPVSLGFQLYNMQNDYDVYTERQRGGGVNVGRPWFWKKPDFSRVFASYSLENISFTNLNSIDPASREMLQSSAGTASKVTLSFTRNSTDNPFYPTAGSRTNASVELAGGILGGELNYYKPFIDQRVYFVPFWKPALMIRNRFSWISPYRRGGVVPGSETFRLGGTRVDYLRGYPDYYVVPDANIHFVNGKESRFPGGNTAYVFTAEYQFPLFNPVRGLFFLDAGNTWNSSRDITLSNLKKGVGAGIRMEIPMLGPVGFDYAYGIDRGRWQAHFIIGPAF